MIHPELRVKIGFKRVKLALERTFCLSSEMTLRIITFMFNRPLRDDFSPRSKKTSIRGHFHYK